jgi:dTDP-4-dehydrorhamnose reductase
MRVMILGSEGSLGSELKRVFPDATALGRNELDITEGKKVDEVLEDLRPDIVLNAAAYTNVDNAETGGETAHKVNYNGVMRLINACDRNRIRLIHFSTDYVFDGENPSGYLESDRRNPINVYGLSKAKGEEIIERSTGEHMIIRTGWLYGRKKSFPSKIIAKAKSEGLVKVVDDQFGSPTYAADLAERIPQMLEAPKGIYHLTNTGILCSWFDFAEEIVKLSGFECAVLPVSSEELALPAMRPKYSILLNSKSQITGPMRDWRSALLDYMKAQGVVKA